MFTSVKSEFSIQKDCRGWINTYSYQILLILLTHKCITHNIVCDRTLDWTSADLSMFFVFDSIKIYLRNLALIHISINSYLGCIFRATIEILFDNQLFDFSDSITLRNKLFIETLFCANKWINEFLIFVLLIVYFAALLSAVLKCYPGVSLILLLVISN